MSENASSHSSSSSTPSSNRLQHFFYQVAHYVLTHTLSTLSIIVLCCVLSIYLIIDRIKVDNNLEVFAPVGSEILKSRDHYQKLFGRDDLFMISVEGDVFQADFLKKLKKLEEEIKSLDLDIKSLGMSRADWQKLQSLNQNSPQGSNNTTRTKKSDATHTATQATALSASSAHTTMDEWDDMDEGDDAWGDEKGGSVIEETISLVSVRRTYQHKNALRVEPWFDPIPHQSEIDRLKPLALQDDLLAQRLIDQHGQFTVILVRAALMLDDDLNLVYEGIKKIVLPYSQEGFAIQVTGPPAVNAALNELVLNDLTQLLLLSGMAMFLALIYLFRRPLMIIGPMIVVTVSVIWTIGVMAYLDMGLNLLSSILPAFLLCVGMGDSIHLQSIYKSKCKQGYSSHQAILASCSLTGPPVLFTSLTTMIGLFSFQFATVTAVTEMGLAGGIGVFFALLHSLVTLPIFLKWQKSTHTKHVSDAHSSSVHSSSAHEEAQHQEQLLSHHEHTQTQETDHAHALNHPPKDHIDKALGFLVHLSYTRTSRRLVILGAIIVVGLALWGMTRLEVWHDDLETLPPKHPIKSAIYKVDAALGGVASAQYIIHDSTSLGVKRKETLQAIHQLSQHALAYREADQTQLVGHALSIVNVVKETHQALMGDQTQKPKPSTGKDLAHSTSAVTPTYLKSQAQTSQLLNLFELQSPDELRRISTIDLKDSYLTLQIKWREATSYQDFIQWMQQGIEKYIPQEVECQPTGGIYLAYNIVSSLLNDLLRSFMGAFLVITFLMVLMLRSWKLGLLAMIPNLTPIIIMLGALGHLEIPLDLNNLLIASIALGIAVDDTIHLLHHFQISYQESGDCEQAIQSSLTHAGRAMLSTSILLFTGFIVYLAASTVAIQRFGVVIASTIMLAFVVDLILCPAILRIAYGSSNNRI